MLEENPINHAEQAAQEALDKIYFCIDRGKSFLLEAGAGAGKTYSLVKTLKYLIDKQGNELLRKRQRIACITYTNGASDEIEARIDQHPAVISSTIHAFCWLAIKDFQPFLQEKIYFLDKLRDKLGESTRTEIQKIDYELGYRSVRNGCVLLGHDDVIALTVLLMKEYKFRALFTARYPILLIDEYQDTNKDFAWALTEFFLNKVESPLVGFFGDHWQKIYRDGCGKIEHEGLEVINKRANFRSVKTIVEVLNRLRPDLQQNVKDQDEVGFLQVYHTNLWSGERLKGSHFSGDLPRNIAHDYLDFIREYLANEGWDFCPSKTRILMLTHNVLAEEQGYSNLAKAFSYNEAFAKKEDSYISFFVDVLEPSCVAYSNKRYGDMFTILGSRTPAIRTHSDKKSWAETMEKLLNLRKTSSIGDVLDYLMQTKHLRLPDAIKRREDEIKQMPLGQLPQIDSLKQIYNLRQVSYQEVIALTQFLNEHTPFATKHGVKGAEFDNVLVVLGRGWNHYNFNQMLEWIEVGIPSDKQETFERNRNLFYVVCSRPKKRLALLFTQELSPNALKTLAKWFGESTIHAI